MPTSSNVRYKTRSILIETVMKTTKLIGLLIEDFPQVTDYIDTVDEYYQLFLS